MSLTPISALGTLPQLQDKLQPSPLMPVLFMGHGSPMNAITDNVYRQTWQRLGQRFGTEHDGAFPQPQLILCISAHWMTNGQGFWLTGQERPRTIHDFGGFPRELFQQQYPAPGAPWAARAIQSAVQHESSLALPALGIDTQEWGFDHGAWSVLLPMFPRAHIPTLQLSIDMYASLEQHLALGRALRSLRQKGVLIIGSGNVVHNLRALMQNGPQPTDWGQEFDAYVQQSVANHCTECLTQFASMAVTAKMAHPTLDHFLPLLVALGAASEQDKLEVLHGKQAAGAISMRSFVWQRA